LHERYERDLGNDLGNLLSRTTALIARFRGGRLTDSAHPGTIADAVERVATAVPAQLDEYDLTGGLDSAWELVRALNRHVEQTKPWEIAKDDSRAEELDGVLYELADGLRAVAIALSAYLPETSAQILTALRQPDDLSWDLVAPGRTVAAEGIEASEPLFPRVDLPAAAA
jgi:methionyl-tRNA synthetase